jgi:hypothetical protein
VLAHTIFDIVFDSEHELDGEEDAKDDNGDVDEELKVSILKSQLYSWIGFGQHSAHSSAYPSRRDGISEC